MRPTEEVEQEILDQWDLENRLWNSGLFKSLRRNVRYSTPRRNGEYDLYGKLFSGRRLYGEVKSKDNEHAWRRARSQFEGAMLAYPDRKWVFLYITPTKIRRYAPVGIMKPT